MSLLLGLVASMSDRQLVGQYPTSSGLKQLSDTIVLKIVPKLPTNNHKRTLTQGDHEFHYKVSGEYVYFCVAQKNATKRVCWAFIDELENYVMKNGPKKLKNAIKDKLDHFNDPSNDKINLLHTKIDDVKDVMIENIDKILERGEKLETLVESTDQLADGARQFRQGTRKVKNRMMCKYFVMLTALILVVLAIIVIAVFIGCKFPTFARCRPNYKPT
jgi:vesicle-associated membrane protein 7